MPWAKELRGLARTTSSSTPDGLVALPLARQDWRRDAPSEELLVQLMRFRATVATLGASTAIERFGDAVRGESAEWGRILSWYGSGDVASASFVKNQIGRELAEAQEVSLAYYGTVPAPRELGDALNEHPGGMIGPDGPRALDWGIWAAFYQRHLCGAITVLPHTR